MKPRVLVLLSLSLTLATRAQAQDAIWRVVHDAQKSEIILVLSPVDLPGYMPDMPDMPTMVQPPAHTVALPVTGYLHGITIEMLDSAGHELPASLLHHTTTIAPQRRELFSEIMQRVGAAGAETGPLQFPRLIGYPINAGDSLLLSVMFHNESEQSYEHA